MRIRKKQHPFLHGVAFLFTGGASAPISAAMMGGKAVRNRKADTEMAALTAAASGAQRPAQPDRRTAGERLRELDQLRNARLISAQEWQERRREIIAGI